MAILVNVYKVTINKRMAAVNVDSYVNLAVLMVLFHAKASLFGFIY